MSNTIALFVGRSGVGKTTVANYMCSHYEMTQIESYTTRAPRFKNEPGHIFISEEEFDKLQDMVAFTLFDGKRYCATSQQVDENDIYVVDVCGVEYFKKAYKGKKNVKVFYFTLPDDALIQRLLMRGENAESIQKRLTADKIMFANAQRRLEAIYPDVYVIDNIDLKTTANIIMQHLSGVQKGEDDARN